MSEQAATEDRATPAMPKIGLRSIGGHAMIYGIGMLANRAVGFVMLPVYTRYLTTADYGIINLIELTFDVLSIVAGSRLALGVFRFFHKAETERERKRVVSTALLLTSLLAVPIGLGAIAAAGPLASLVFRAPDLQLLFRIAGLSFVAQAFQIVPFAYLQLRNRSRFYVGVQMARMVVQVILNITFLVGMEMGPQGILLSSLIANVLTGMVLVFIVWKDCGMAFDTGASKDLIRYGAPLMLTQVATFFITFGDRYFLQHFGGASVVGVYSLSYSFAFLLGTLAAQPFQMVWNPVRFDIVKRDDRDEVHARAFVFYNVFLLALALGIALFVGDALRVLTTPDFFAAADVVPILILAYIFQSWVFHDIGILVAEKTGYIALANWLSAAVIATAYFLLIPPLGVWGAAIGTLLAMSLRWLMLYVVSQRLLYIAYRWRPVLVMLATAIAVTVVSNLLPTLRLIPSIAVNIALYLVWIVSIPLLALSRVEVREILGAARSLWEMLLMRWRQRGRATV